MRWWAETSVSVSEGNVYVPVCDDQVEVTVHIDISGDGKLRARGNVKTGRGTKRTRTVS
jgi:hypothetical protein